jgi:hypothetical protein
MDGTSLFFLDVNFPVNDNIPLPGHFMDFYVGEVFLSYKPDQFVTILIERGMHERKKQLKHSWFE